MGFNDPKVVYFEYTRKEVISLAEKIYLNSISITTSEEDARGRAIKSFHLAQAFFNVESTYI